MPRVIHFEILADQPDRAAAFYQKVFNWGVQKWGGPAEYWLLKTGEDSEPGINGAIMSREEPGSVYNTIDVPSVEEYIFRIMECGGSVVMPKTAVPGVGYMAYCADTEGNIFGIMEQNPEAK
jgi:predicted enzyme related to lactoylglutathione lyase